MSPNNSAPSSPQGSPAPSLGPLRGFSFDFSLDEVPVDEEYPFSPTTEEDFSKSPHESSEYTIDLKERRSSTREGSRHHSIKSLTVILCSILALIALHVRRPAKRTALAKELMELSARIFERKPDGGKAYPAAAELSDDVFTFEEGLTGIDESSSSFSSSSSSRSVDSQEQQYDDDEQQQEQETQFRLPGRKFNVIELPDVDEAEALMSKEELEGKHFLANYVIVDESEEEFNPDDDEEPVVEEEEVDPALAAIARLISDGETDKLVDSIVHLEDVKPLDSSLPAGDTNRSFKVTRFLGKGVSSVVVAVVDEETGEEHAMRLHVLEKLNVSEEQTTKLVLQAADKENRCIDTAVEGVSAAEVANKRGFSVPRYTGKIAGASTLTLCGDMYVVSGVQLFQRLHGSVKEIINHLWRIPPNAKLYVARRLLIEVMHLQAAGVAHNDLRLDNCFMMKDGSFLLGDFGASTPFGEEIAELTRVTMAYADPQMLIDLKDFLKSERSSVTPSPNGDLWSLGMILYELFADGRMPFGIAHSRRDFEQMQKVAADLVNREFDEDNQISVAAEVYAGLQKEEHIPERWKQLICCLLEPNRSKRPSWTEIAMRFPDLLLQAEVQ
ncbi:hypothetical protein, conserved [Eimeria acervulina]|uniref:non-specific serine/threonine protein kinase n=1 Tax=Eimeria acervulina TaxID=5801 RepID=U6GFQ5_EIMAC|nr:hypothetical protein, conserved [Eimeria acervulina]CDI77419.1 hypothetical protein, conserved [Eimeria acervulina]